MMEGFHDLGNGWKRKLVTRKTGTRKGCVDVYIKTPDGKIIRSKLMLKKYLLEHKISDIDVKELYPSFKKNEVSDNKTEDNMCISDCDMKPRKADEICIDSALRNLDTSKYDMKPRKDDGICMDTELQNLDTSYCDMKPRKDEICIRSTLGNLDTSKYDMNPRKDNGICLDTEFQNFNTPYCDMHSRKDDKIFTDLVLQNLSSSVCEMKPKKDDKLCMNSAHLILGTTDYDMKSMKDDEICMYTKLQNLNTLNCDVTSRKDAKIFMDSIRQNSCTSHCVIKPWKDNEIFMDSEFQSLGNSVCDVKLRKDGQISIDSELQNLNTSDCDMKPKKNDQICMESILQTCNKDLKHASTIDMKKVILGSGHNLLSIDVSPSFRKKCIRSPYYMNIKKENSFRKKLLSGNRQKWTPPRSPLNLIQESLFDRPWHLLIATIFLNRTSGQLGTQYAWKFFDKWNSPQAVLNAKDEDLVEFLKPIGLQEIRASQIKTFTDQFLHRDWKSPDELFGIGKYGKDSYNIFCVGDLKTNPKDGKLKEYIQWYNQNFSKTVLK